MELNVSRLIKASTVPTTPLKLYLLIGSIAALASGSSLACGGIFDVACNLRSGGLSPGNIVAQTHKAGGDIANTAQKAGQDVGNAINELQASLLTGPTLEQAINASRNTAINGAMPIPPNIRQQLTGYASDESMNRVRYKIGDSGFFNLARLLEQGGFASAVTLNDVIVFRGPSEAADAAIWAHELTHVDQYRSGVHSFAVRYARNWNSIEDPAYSKGDGFYAWRQGQPMMMAANQSNYQSYARPGLPFGTTLLVCGCYGPGPSVVAEPQCSSGAAMAYPCNGVGYCPGGGIPYGYACH